VNKINISEFINLADKIPVVDVRSPSEFNTGHIPGAFNIPLFKDSERVTVGTIYKKEGREQAIVKGIQLSGPSMHLKLTEGLKISCNGKLLVYCWRGGMRSEAMAWLFSLGGINCQVLDGGYKSYRNFILSSLSEKRKIIVLGGMTGSGKTHLLKRIHEEGEQFIDLEKIANHKGSSFGALGEAPQPSSEHFANLLYTRWRLLDNSKPLWLEDESRNIGTVFLPDTFYNNFQDAPTIVLMMEPVTRLPRLIKEYSLFPQEMLSESVRKISKRLGGDNTREALNAIEEGDFGRAIMITLRYYDKAYLYGITRKKKENLIFVETDSDNVDLNASKILEAARKITW
jgi:tRNA 2-selenouridine synthase